MIQLNIELKQDENGYWIAEVPGSFSAGIGDNPSEALIRMFEGLAKDFEPTNKFRENLMLPEIRRIMKELPGYELEPGYY